VQQARRAAWRLWAFATLNVILAALPGISSGFVGMILLLLEVGFSLRRWSSASEDHLPVFPTDRCGLGGDPSIRMMVVRAIPVTCWIWWRLTPAATAARITSSRLA